MSNFKKENFKFFNCFKFFKLMKLFESFRMFRILSNPYESFRVFSNPSNPSNLEVRFEAFKLFEIRFLLFDSNRIRTPLVLGSFFAHRFWFWDRFLFTDFGFGIVFCSIPFYVIVWERRNIGLTKNILFWHAA